MCMHKLVTTIHTTVSASIYITLNTICVHGQSSACTTIGYSVLTYQCMIITTVSMSVTNIIILQTVCKLLRCVAFKKNKSTSTADLIINAVSTTIWNSIRCTVGLQCINSKYFNTNHVNSFIIIPLPQTTIC